MRVLLSQNRLKRNPIFITLLLCIFQNLTNMIDSDIARKETLFLFPLQTIA